MRPENSCRKQNSYPNHYLKARTQRGSFNSSIRRRSLGMMGIEAAWTDDTDHALLIVLSYLHHNGKELSPKDVAKRLQIWVEQGLRCLDRPPCGLGRTVGTVRCPILRFDKYLAPNGSLMRTHPLGVMCISATLPETFQIAADYSAITHADPRCIVSCCTVTGLIRGILRGQVLNEGNVDEIIEKAFVWVDEWVRRRASGASGSGCTPEENELQEHGALLEIEEYTRHARATSFKELELDDSQKMGYVYKTFGAAILALRLGIRQTGYEQKCRTNSTAKLPHSVIFEKVITELTFEGGDADTNACVAGALLGCWFGYNSLPPQWRDGMQHVAWIAGKCEALTQTVGVEETISDNGLQLKYNGSKDPDTSIDGGKGLMNAEGLKKRDEDFMYRYLARSKDATEREKRRLEASERNQTKGVFSSLRGYLSK
ncbi:ADP-ribosylglycohydrolase [Histoplasma capsulatum var. duboisii H88]|uniref:ADP-ribosylglycohydrolase n=3 Tax=Ajellomyces capsulatus TaxID=5037 RepID=F0UD72_AJEC8|nr:ADP-ribosylglycohydrolase [Histoplasma capsulatum var. duboisii H88]